MASNVANRVRQHRDHLRAAGLRPLQIWVPDTSRPGFAEECRRQSTLVALSDVDDHELQSFMKDAVDAMEGWGE